MSEQRDIYVPPGGPGNLPELSPEIYKSMGEPGVYRMMEDFYQKLGKSKIRPLFSDDLLAASRRGAAFYIQLFGGPPLYNQRFGNPMMRRRHFPFEIDESARRIWLRCFYKTLEDSADYDFPPEHLRDFREWLDGFSRWMVNKKTEEG